MTYEYICRACGHQWEAEQRISEDPLTECPHCGKPEAKRQISGGGGFILKGGGWYSDLYSSQKPAKADGSDSTDDKKKNDSKSDSKAKSDTKVDSSSTDVAAKATATSPTPSKAAKSTSSSSPSKK